MAELDVVRDCPLCGAGEVDYLIRSTWAKNDRQLLDMLGMEYAPASWAHCGACNHVFLNPSFSAQIEGRLYGVESIYRRYSIAGKTEDQYLAEIDPAIKDSSLVHSGHLGKLSRIKEVLKLKHAVCVDFGAGFGSAESAVVSLGWTYYGFEKDAWCLGKARELGRSVKESLPEAVGREGADLIYSSQVFEHIKRPNEVSEIVRSILKPGGHIYINVPTHAYSFRNLSSIGPGGLKCMNWGHYHSYSPASLSCMLSSWGFTIVDLWLAGGDVNILAQKKHPSQAGGADRGRRYSTGVERAKIQLLRWVLSPLKSLLIDFPTTLSVSFLQKYAPKSFKSWVRRVRARRE